MITGPIPDKTGIPFDDPIMICAGRSVCLVRTINIGDHLEQAQNVCERGAGAPFLIANSVILSASDREALADAFK